MCRVCVRVCLCVVGDLRGGGREIARVGVNVRGPRLVRPSVNLSVEVIEIYRQDFAPTLKNRGNVYNFKRNPQIVRGGENLYCARFAFAGRVWAVRIDADQINATATTTATATATSSSPLWVKVWLCLFSVAALIGD